MHLAQKETMEKEETRMRTSDETHLAQKEKVEKEETMMRTNDVTCTWHRRRRWRRRRRG